ncbi:hypothetical protein HYT59_01410 [Candidatus Woesebacteria bacterium]|nr:hypothetical protein [Candidatus Woesebacteria bacterium]
MEEKKTDLNNPSGQNPGSPQPSAGVNDPGSSATKTPNQFPTPSPTSPKKKIVLIVATVLLLLAAGAGAAYFLVFKNQTAQPTPTPSPITAENLFENKWENYEDNGTGLYSNKELGFSFEYPKNLSIFQSKDKTVNPINIIPFDRSQEDFINILEPNYRFQIVVIKDPENLDNFLDAWTRMSTMTDKRETSIKTNNNITFTKVAGTVHEDMFGEPYQEFYYISNKEITYLLLPGFGTFDQTDHKYKYEDLCPIAQILFTFRFLDQNDNLSQKCGVCGSQGVHNVEGRTCAERLVCKEGKTTSGSYCVAETEDVGVCE